MYKKNTEPLRCSVQEFIKRRRGNRCVEDGEVRCTLPPCKACHINYKVHELKTWPEFFQAMWNNDKPFEYRKNDDRDFKKGDLLICQEWNPKTQEYTGREIDARVTYVLENQMGVPEGYAILGLCIGAKISQVR